MFINLILTSLSDPELAFWIIMLAIFAFASGFLLGHSVNFKHIDQTGVEMEEDDEDDEEEEEDTDTNTDKGGDNE